MAVSMASSLCVLNSSCLRLAESGPSCRSRIQPGSSASFRPTRLVAYSSLSPSNFRSRFIGLNGPSLCVGTRSGCCSQLRSLSGDEFLGGRGGGRCVGGQAHTRRGGRIVAEQKPDIFRALGVVLRVGKEGLDAGTQLVPEAVPRPVARVGVGLVGAVVGSFLLKSLFSTALFILAIAAFSYMAYSFISKDSDSNGGGGSGGGSSGKGRSTEDSLEEARRIMEKYK